ncbi:MAG TPA: PLDc N-terminal domain-containing protein [Herpetosiphonaceae bacterium]
MSDRQKTILLTLGSVQISLLLTALVDIRRRLPEEINGSKRLWTALAFVNFIGPIAYFVWGRKRRAA